MKYLLILLSFFLVVLSCRKADTEDRSAPAYILKSGKWYLAQERWLKYDTSQNLILEDTTYYSDSCRLVSFYRFYDDSLCYKREVCTMAGAPELPGKWYLQGDTILSANVQVRLSYGGGYIPRNIGILPSKLMEISSDHFVVKAMYWFPWNPPNTVIQDTVISTYRRL